MSTFNFLTCKSISTYLCTINLNLFHNLGEIHSFVRKQNLWRDESPLGSIEIEDASFRVFLKHWSSTWQSFFDILLILTRGLKKRGQENKGTLILKWGSWGTGCTLALGAQRNFKQSLPLCLHLCVYKKEKLLNVLLNCSFYALLIGLFRYA